jgi:hypothetical protein
MARWSVLVVLAVVGLPNVPHSHAQSPASPELEVVASNQAELQREP